ncbi:unnamed protein product [Peronospora belbahrii]|nr:unnamed protein product [Peronospora belbahrii]
MARAHDVVLRVRAYGQQGVEFALSSPQYNDKRGIFTWWIIIALILSSIAVLSSIKWDVSSTFRLFMGLVIGILVAFVFQASGSVVVEESMLVVPALGVRLTTRRRNGSIRSKFVDLDRICGVAVNEAITFSSVVYSLVLMVEGQHDMMLPFETFRPRVAVLQDIYQETQMLLFPDDSDRKMRLPDHVALRPC